MSKLHLSLTALLFGILFLSSCSQKESELGQSADSVSMSPDFKNFLAKFPQQSGPFSLPLKEDEYSNENLEAIDSATAAMFLNNDVLPFGLDEPIYYHSSVQLQPNVYSVIVHQAVNMPYYGYVLVNFDPTGAIISSKLISYYEFSTGYINTASAKVADNLITITDVQASRLDDEKSSTTSEFKVHPMGVILPVMPLDMVGVFHDAVEKNGQYLIDPVCMGGDEKMSESFQISSRGDSITYFPYPDGESLILQRCTKSSDNSYSLEFRSLDNPDDLTPSYFTLRAISSKPGVYQLGEEGEAYVISEKFLSSYKARELPCPDENFLITPRGISATNLGYDARFEDIERKYNLTYYTVAGDEENATRQRFVDAQKNPVMDLEADPGSGKITAISLLSPLFKTDHGIGLGSTVEELLYAHENVSAICGEYGVLISIDWYKDVTFFIDDTMGAPGTEVDLNTINKTLKIDRIDIR